MRVDATVEGIVVAFGGFEDFVLVCPCVPVGIGHLFVDGFDFLGAGETVLDLGHRTGKGNDLITGQAKLLCYLVFHAPIVLDGEVLVNKLGSTIDVFWAVVSPCVV